MRRKHSADRFAHPSAVRNDRRPVTPDDFSRRRVLSRVDRSIDEIRRVTVHSQLTPYLFVLCTHGVFSCCHILLSQSSWGRSLPIVLRLAGGESWRRDTFQCVLAFGRRLFLVYSLVVLLWCPRTEVCRRVPPQSWTRSQDLGCSDGSGGLSRR